MLQWSIDLALSNVDTLKKKLFSPFHVPSLSLYFRLESISRSISLLLLYPCPFERDTQ